MSRVMPSGSRKYNTGSLPVRSGTPAYSVGRKELLHNLGVTVWVLVPGMLLEFNTTKAGRFAFMLPRP